jgi:hypothetical protein
MSRAALIRCAGDQELGGADRADAGLIEQDGHGLADEFAQPRWHAERFAGRRYAVRHNA